MAITAAELMVTVGADTSRATAELQSFSDRMAGVSRSLGAQGTLLSAGITTPVMSIGSKALFTAADFETAMNRVAALSGATGEEFDDLRSLAMELGASTQFSASQAADAMGFLAMAGFDANEIIGAMPSTLQLAAAAQLDMGRAADITSNIMTGYGLEVEDLAAMNDVLVASFTNANTDLSMLGEAMKYAGPVASGMGISFEESAAAISLMGNAGIQASMAGTSLRGILTSLASPTKAQAQIMDDLGLSVFDTEGKMRPLVEIMQQLENSGAGAASVMELFGQRAGPAMLALLDQGSGALQSFTDMLDESGGTAERVGSVQMMGLNGALEELKSAWESVQISFMENGGLQTATDLLKKMTDALRDGYEWWQQLDPALQNAAIAFAAVWAAAGPVVLVLAGVAAILAFLSSPLGLVIAGVSALAAAWAADFGGMRTAVTEWWSASQPAFNEASAWLSGTATNAMTSFQSGWQQMVDQLAPNTERLQDSFSGMMAQFGDMSDRFDGLGEALERLGAALKPIIGLIGAGLTIAITLVMNRISSLMNRLPETVDLAIAQVENAINTVAGILEEATALVQAVIDGDWSAAWESLKNIGITAFEGLENQAEIAIGLIGVMLGGLKDTVADTMRDFGMDISAPLDEIEAQVRSFWAWLTGLTWEERWNALGEGFGAIVDSLLVWQWPDLSALLEWQWPDLSKLLTWKWPALPSFEWPSLPRWLGGAGNNAAGALNWGGGLTWVGERGPELVALPGGSRIYNNNEAMAMTGGGGVTIQEIHIHNEMDVEVLINQLRRRLRL